MYGHSKLSDTQKSRCLTHEKYILLCFNFLLVGTFVYSLANKFPTNCGHGYCRPRVSFFCAEINVITDSTGNSFFREIRKHSRHFIINPRVRSWDESAILVEQSSENLMHRSSTVVMDEWLLPP